MWSRNSVSPTVTMKLIRSANALAFGCLARQEERLDQFTLTANGHPRELLVPRSLRNLRLDIQPFGEQFELLRIDAALLNALQQVLEQERRNIAADLRHASDAVETSGNPLLQARGFD